MTITKLYSELAKREKTKSQARIQAIISIVGHLSDIISDEYFDHDWSTVDTLIKNGERRARKGKRK